ncbi:Nucleosomal histone H3-Lys79 methylase [Phlyctochytrium bullatum]|nr:Nucleosomal histone H3-Lys79 methylase [Phlyctochytrium bullatum]
MLHRTLARPSCPHPQRFVYIRRDVADAIAPSALGTPPETEPKSDEEMEGSSLEKTLIQSRDVVCQNAKVYRPLPGEDGQVAKKGIDTCKSVSLDFPSGERESFLLAEPVKRDEYNPLNDIKATAYVIARNCIHPDHAHLFGDENAGILRAIIKACNRRNAEDLQAALEGFNAAMEKCRTEKLFLSDDSPSSQDFVGFVLEQAYARAVSPFVRSLKSYKGFSNYVYGEVKPKFVGDLIEKTGLSSKMEAGQDLWYCK